MNFEDVASDAGYLNRTLGSAEMTHQSQLVSPPGHATSFQPNPVVQQSVPPRLFGGINISESQQGGMPAEYQRQPSPIDSSGARSASREVSPGRSGHEQKETFHGASRAGDLAQNRNPEARPPSNISKISPANTTKDAAEIMNNLPLEAATGIDAAGRSQLVNSHRATFDAVSIITSPPVTVNNTAGSKLPPKSTIPSSGSTGQKPWSNPLFHREEVKTVVLCLLEALKLDTAQRDTSVLEQAESRQFRERVLAELSKVVEERDQVVKSFVSLNDRFEKCKQLVRNYRANEDELKRELVRAVAIVNQQRTERAEVEDRGEATNLAKDQEIARLRASLKMSDMKIKHLEEEVRRKQAEKDQISQLVEELSSGAGKK